MDTPNNSIAPSAVIDHQVSLGNRNDNSRSPKSPKTPAPLKVINDSTESDSAPWEPEDYREIDGDYGHAWSTGEPLGLWGSLRLCDLMGISLLHWRNTKDSLELDVP